MLNPELVKGPWTAEEDAKVIDLVHAHGAKKWSVIANALPGRIGKQCRERYVRTRLAERTMILLRKPSRVVAHEHPF